MDCDTCKPRQTVNSYIASLQRLDPDIKTQVNAWPYPQAEQSHLLVQLRDKNIQVKLINTDMPGALIRVANDTPTPREVIEQLRR